MGKKLKAAVIFIILLLADQLTKLWAVKVLKPIGSIPVIRNVLEIYYVENRGAAFGIMQNKQWFFLIITLAVLAGLIWISGDTGGKTFYSVKDMPVFRGSRSCRKYDRPHFQEVRCRFCLFQPH